MIKKITLTFAILLVSLLPTVAQDPWIITTEQPHQEPYYGALVGNGMLGLLSSNEPLKLKQVILAGLYDQYGEGRVATTIQNFNLLDLRLVIGWEDVNAASISNFKQELDMQNGTFTGSFDFKDKATVEYSYYALRHLPHTAMVDIKVKAHQRIPLVVENIVQTPPSFRDSRNYYNEVNPPHAYIPLLTTTARTPINNTLVVASNTFLFPEQHGDEPRVLHEMRHTNSHLMQFTRNIETDKEYCFSLIGNLISSEQVEDPYNQAERLAIYAKLQGHDALIAGHRKAWEKLWESDILIEGDDQVQQDIHNMLYHIYSSVREGSDYSLSPFGLSSTGYMGHVFWDTEIWMFPPLLLLHPEIAKGLINYRFKRLDAAKQNAQLHGYRGAMYPWESAKTGEEETPVWALSGPYEHHITADVAIAAWNYYLVTKDKAWLQEVGYPILRETATFWESRVSKKGDLYEIKNVVCPDEWAENVDNNGYTNEAARLNLIYANAAAKVLGLPTNSNWSNIAEHIIPLQQMGNGVTREHDSYSGEPIKQADVNLLAYPLKVITNKEQISRDLAYYEQRVPKSDTPAMTQAIFALLYSRLGDSEKAYHWFVDAYQEHLLPPFRVLAESKGGTNPFFITGAGGVLQTILMGFGGLDILPNGGVKQLKTAMPKHWKKLTLKGIGTDKKMYVITQ